MGKLVWLWKCNEIDELWDLITFDVLVPSGGEKPGSDRTVVSGSGLMRILQYSRHLLLQLLQLYL